MYLVIDLALDAIFQCDGSEWQELCTQAAAVQELIRSGADDVKSKALQTAGNLAFCQENRQLILRAEGFKDIIVRMADQGGVVKHETRMSAIRALAILGQLPCPAASCPCHTPRISQ